MKNFLIGKNNYSPWGFNFFDDLDDFFKPLITRQNVANTDIKETETGYELSLDMPGFEKKDITLTLNKGYLTVSANREDNEEEKGYIVRERKQSVKRSFFVGDNITEEDVKAKYLNGTLILSVPKKQAKEIVSKTIEID